MTQRFTRCFLIALLFCAAEADAQFFYFGRNKVQYTDFEWHVLKTDHFDIYYYTEMKDLAERGAAFAEEAYSFLQLKFNHTLGSRVPLIFYSSHLHFQQTNTTGGVHPRGGRRLFRISERPRGNPGRRFDIPIPSCDPS